MSNPDKVSAKHTRPTGPHDVIEGVWYYRYPTHVELIIEERDKSGKYIETHHVKVYSKRVVKVP